MLLGHGLKQLRVQLSQVRTFGEQSFPDKARRLRLRELVNFCLQRKIWFELRKNDRLFSEGMGCPPPLMLN